MHLNTVIFYSSFNHEPFLPRLLICMYIYTHIHTHMHAYIYIQIYIHTHVNAYRVNYTHSIKYLCKKLVICPIEFPIPCCCLIASLWLHWGCSSVSHISFYWWLDREFWWDVGSIFVSNHYIVHLKLTQCLRKAGGKNLGLILLARIFTS